MWPEGQEIQQTNIRAPEYRLPIGKSVPIKKKEEDAVNIIGLDGWKMRIQAGKREAARQGYHQGGITPYGYRKVFDPARKRFLLSPDAFQTSVVRSVFREYLRLQSLGKVAQRLNELNIPSATSGAWSRQAIGFMLSNPVYIGRVSYGAVQGSGEHQPLIAPIVFNMVQKLKRENNRRGT